MSRKFITLTHIYQIFLVKKIKMQSSKIITSISLVISNTLNLVNYWEKEKFIPVKRS